MDFDFVNFSAITVICLVAAKFLKAKAICNNWIPVVCGILGMILGVAGLWLVADFPADDVLNAAAVGAVSGLAATGVHQAWKQLGG